MQWPESPAPSKHGMRAVVVTLLCGVSMGFMAEKSPLILWFPLKFQSFVSG